MPFSFLQTIVSEEQYVDVSQRTARLTLAATSALLLAMLFIRYVFEGATNGADNSSHLAEILAISELFRSGEFDFWSYDFSLGYPFFIGYNALPYLIMGLITALLNGSVEPTVIYNATVALLSAILPLSWYYAGRLLQLPRLTALLFSFAPLLLADQTGFGATIYSISSWGLFTQLWGMLVLPIAVASYYRLLTLRENRLCQTILWHSLLCSLHCLLGVFTGFCALVLFFFHLRSWKVFLCSQLVVLILFSYWVYPYLMYNDYLLQISFTQHPIYGERSLLPLLKNFITGKFFSYFDLDFPFQTVLLLFGIFATLLFSPNRLRYQALIIFGFALFGYFSFPGDNYFSNLLPTLKEIPARRYLSLMHFSGALLIAWGTSYLLFKLARIVSLGTNIPYASVVKDLSAIILVLAIGKIGSVASDAFRNARLDDSFYATAERLKQENSLGRFFVHGNYGTGSHLYRNYMTILSQTPQTTTYARGVRDSLSFYYLEPFHFHPANFELYNIRYIVAAKQANEKFYPSFSLLQQARHHRLYRADKDYGNFDVVHSNFSIDSFTSEQAINFMRAQTHLLYHKKILPLITDQPPDNLPLINTTARTPQFLHSKIGNTRVEITEKEFIQAVTNVSPPAWSNLQEVKQESGYRVKVVMEDEAYVVLKASFHPNWQAKANGKDVPIQMVAPNFMAVKLPAGSHEVSFSFHSDTLPKVLFMLMLLAWLLTIIWLNRRYLLIIK